MTAIVPLKISLKLILLERRHNWASDAGLRNTFNDMGYINSIEHGIKQLKLDKIKVGQVFLFQLAHYDNILKF